MSQSARSLPPILTRIVMCLYLANADEALAQSSPGSRHFLWRVVNAPAPFYLLGSVHALKKTDYPLPHVVEDAARQSRVMLFDMDPNQNATFHRLIYNSARY